jgi:hypothetical protein
MSPAYRTHPEFGYLCPSRSLRRLAWTALAVAAFATLAGAFVLGAGRDGPDGRAAPVASVNAAPSATAAKPAAELATATATTTPRPPERGKAACEGDTWTYLEGKCVSGRMQGPRSAAATDSPPLAALPLGRSAPPPPEPARAIEAAAPAAPAEPERAAPAVAAVPETAASDGPSASVPKAGKKAGKKAARGRSGARDVAGVKGSSRVDRQTSMPRSATTWAKQLQGCAEGARCPAGEQLMRALLSSGI